MSDELPTAQVQNTESSRSDGRLVLVALSEDGVSTFPLPTAGQVLIGRSREADVSIDSSSISRRHALLEIGEGLRVQDLGSSNGTRLRQARLEAEVWTPFQPGEAIELGAVLLVVQRNPRVERPRRIWTHGYFEARLEDECLRGAADFTVARLHLEDSTVSPTRVCEALAMELQPGDLLASYAPGEYEAILFGVGSEGAARREDELSARLEELSIAATVGFACYPRDGRNPELLIAKACEALRGPRPDPGGPEVVIADPAMVQLYRMIDRIAPGTINVLVLGETGVGKELVGEAVHRRSPRSAKPYLRLNCAALPEALLESELFGHEKGAFTGATEAKAGLLESANGGTVFLDEIGELPASTQAKLLRVLEERAVRRVGGVKARPLDLRFVAATNRDLEAEVSQGRFRKDLYFRLAGVTLVVPPLRERVAEIAPLARAFAAQAARELARPRQVRLSAEATARLEQYPWPGNIRELRNAIERAVLLCEAGEIGLEHLPLDKMSAVWVPPASPQQPAGPGDAAERQRIVDALHRCGGNQTQAAKLLGISRRTLLYRLDEYDIPRPQKKVPQGAGPSTGSG